MSCSPRIATVLVALLAAACARAPEVVERPGEPDVVPVGGDDVEMNQAMEQARDTLDQFIARLDDPPPTQVHLGLKVRFDRGGNTEHMWLRNVVYTPPSFVGYVGNEPLHDEMPALGERVTVPKEAVSDWMAIDSGRLVGGYTIRLLRSRMSPDERAAFDSQTGFTID